MKKQQVRGDTPQEKLIAIANGDPEPPELGQLKSIPEESGSEAEQIAHLAKAMKLKSWETKNLKLTDLTMPLQVRTTLVGPTDYGKQVPVELQMITMDYIGYCFPITKRTKCGGISLESEEQRGIESWALAVKTKLPERRMIRISEKYEREMKCGNKDHAPESEQEMLQRSDRAEYEEAERKHLAKIGPQGLDVYEEVELPPGCTVMKAKWVYAQKERAHSKGELERSARITACGYSQKEGQDYGRYETSMQTMAISSYLCQEANAVNSDTKIFDEVWDISGAYYHSWPTFRQYLRPRARQRNGNLVWCLKRGMPGTKDGGHNFSTQFSDFLIKKVGLKHNTADGALFHMKEGEAWISTAWFVDDGQAFSNSQELLDWVFAEINERYPMKRRSGINLVLGVYVERKIVNGKKETHFHQTPLIDEIVRLAGQEEATPVWTQVPPTWKMFEENDLVRNNEERRKLNKFPFRQILGKIAYVARNTRRDILWIVAILQRVQATYGMRAVSTLLHLVAYLKTSKQLRMIFKGGYEGTYPLIALADAGYASCPITRVSHGGYVLYYMGCPIKAVSRKQSTIALSIMEAEYMTASDCSKDVIHDARKLEGAQLPVRLPIPILEDNEATIKLSAKRSLNSGRARHMEIRWHWMQAQASLGRVKLVYVPTEDQTADIFTKNLTRAAFEKHQATLQGTSRVYQGGVRRALVRLDHAGRFRIQTEQKNSCVNEAMMLSEDLSETQLASFLQNRAESKEGEEEERTISQRAKEEIDELKRVQRINLASYRREQYRKTLYQQAELAKQNARELMRFKSNQRATLSQWEAELNSLSRINSAQMQENTGNKEPVPTEKRYFGRRTIGAEEKTWSPAQTLKEIRAAIGGPSYPNPEAIVAVSGPAEAGKKFHHLLCDSLLAKGGKVKDSAFHGGVYITTLKEARAENYWPCNRCGWRMMRVRGG